MARNIGSQDIDESWTLLFDADGGDEQAARGFRVAVAGASAASAEFFAEGVSSMDRLTTADPDTADGVILEAGQSFEFVGIDPAGDGKITRVWGRSTDPSNEATVTGGVSIR